MSSARTLNIKEVVMKEVRIQHCVGGKTYTFRFKLTSHFIDEQHESICLGFLLTNKGAHVERSIVSEVQNMIASSIQDFISITCLEATISVDHCDHWVNCLLDISDVKLGKETSFMNKQVRGILGRIDRLFDVIEEEVRDPRKNASRKSKRQGYVNRPEVSHS
jgi:hypothetical protein